MQLQTYWHPGHFLVLVTRGASLFKMCLPPGIRSMWFSPDHKYWEAPKLHWELWSHLPSTLPCCCIRTAPYCCFWWSEGRKKARGPFSSEEEPLRRRRRESCISQSFKWTWHWKWKKVIYPQPSKYTTKEAQDDLPSYASEEAATPI